MFILKPLCPLLRLFLVTLGSILNLATGLFNLMTHFFSGLIDFLASLFDRPFFFWQPLKGTSNAAIMTAAAIVFPDLIICFS